MEKGDLVEFKSFPRTWSGRVKALLSDSTFTVLFSEFGTVVVKARDGRVQRSGLADATFRVVPEHLQLTDQESNWV